MRTLQPTPPASGSELLRTKLAPPRLRPTLVARETLLERLDEGLERKLTLLSAPAGFGKTTLVSAWIASRAASHDLPPVAWVALDAGDNDQMRFWRYVLTACRTFAPDAAESALAWLQASQQTPFDPLQPSFFETMLTTFINALALLPGGYVLVLEDYHLIIAPQIHEALAFLLDHLPATLHLMIITRSDPPLPLARLRAYNEVLELHAADLRFSAEETQRFLCQSLPFPLAPETISQLETRTEGWVAGLQLAALALQGRQTAPEMEQFLATFTGSHRHILEYLVAEVFNAQPAPLQEFLLQTAFLSRLTGSLCDAVTARQDSERILEQLERANLFLVPLDGAGRWYRYHALFAEAMQHEARRRLGEDALRSLAYRASLWYEQHGLLAEAIEAALAAHDFARAAALMEDIVSPVQVNSEGQTLRRWMEQLPEEVLRAHPALCFAQAVVILFTLDRSAPATAALLRAPLEMAEQSWRAEGNQRRLGQVLGFRAMIAWWQQDFPQAFILARQSLDLLPEDEPFWRGSSTLHVGMEEMLAGHFDTARQWVIKARALCEIAENHYAVRAATFILGNIYVGQGKLRQAAQLYQQALAEAEAREDFSDQAAGLIDLAALAREWNDLETAGQQVSQALAIARQYADEMGRQLTEETLIIPGSLVLARVLYARGEITQAEQELEEAVALAEQRGGLLTLREALACQAWFQLATGDLAAVERWARARAEDAPPISRLQEEREALLLARLRIAQGAGDAALQILADWQAEVHEQGRFGSELEIIILQALAHAAEKRLPQAKERLLQALTLAQPEGYRRLFLDEGEPLAALLRTTLSEMRDAPQAASMRGLLLAFAQGRAGRDAASSSAAAPLIEPLSPQEQRVLRLLSAGRSNPEIASELIVSINTVKTQVQSIYRKLNVSSRREARDAARQLQLL